MKIRRNTLFSILSGMRPVPPETGGIIGGRNQIVSLCVFDQGSIVSNEYDVYAPDTKLLNQTIRQWAKTDIEFYGVFHSHFPGGAKLSNGDKQYIRQIMYNMPRQVKFLYFPIVFPEEDMVVYRVDKYSHDISIVRDQIEIL